MSSAAPVAPVAAPEPVPRPGSRLLPRFPGLDGLRALAVFAVLAFHANLGWAQGGFLGVSTFFTLSGFLITSLALAEHRRSGTLDLRGFARRRSRRLVPAALAALTLALLYGLFVADAAQRRHLGGDVVASLLWIANWRFIIDGRSYGELFSQPSPVLHFWSLAIEGQFYLVFPLVFALLARWGGQIRTRLIWVLGALTIASVSIPFLWTLDPNRAYLGTGTRAAELLIGALAAAIVHRGRITARIARDAAVRRGLTVAGVVGLMVTVVAWHQAQQSSSFLRHGGFALYSVASTAVVLGTLVPGGAMERVLQWSPLTWVGARSYGLYLFHWPVFLFLTRPGQYLAPMVVLVVGGAISIALADASLRWLEIPVRQGVAPLRLPDRWAGLVGAVAVATMALLLSATAPAPLLDFDAAQVALSRQAASAPAVTPPSITVPASDGDGATSAVATPPPLPRVGIYGDSTALMTSIGFNDWLNEAATGIPVGGVARLGCGIGRGGKRRNGNDIQRIPNECENWEAEWSAMIDTTRPDLVLVQSGGWDAGDRMLWGDNAWRHVGDPVFDEYYRRELLLAVDTLTATGGRVVWLTVPHVGLGKDGNGITSRGDGADPARMDRINELIGELPAKRPGKVAVVDLGGWLADSGQDVHYRPDGVHFGADEGREATRKWLGRAAIDAYDQLVEATPTP